MRDERFDSLEKVDLAMEEFQKENEPGAGARPDRSVQSGQSDRASLPGRSGQSGADAASGGGAGAAAESGGGTSGGKGPGENADAEYDDRRGGGDRRKSTAAWSGVERRSGKDRRLEEAIARKKVPSRKLRGFTALLISFIFLVPALYFLPFLIWSPVEEITWVNEENVPAEYDVIVVGAEPEGIAAAVAAARSGMRTLLLEEAPALGGLMTLGGLNFLDMCHGADGTLLTRGIFEEFYEAVGGTAFDITQAKNYFIDLVTQQPSLTLRTEARLAAPLMEAERIVGVRMLENGRETEYTAKRVIDATADGDLAAMAGVPYTYGGEDIGDPDRQMGVTLVFALSDVSWPGVFFHLNFQRLRGMISGSPAGVGATGKAAWGYEAEGYAYVPRDPMMRLRGFNIARQRNGTVLINALLLFGVNPLDEASRLDAVERAKDELVHLIPYIRQNFSGFGDAELAGTASRLYVRESRHIVGEYQLSIDDVLENRDQWDKIAIGGYPADVQPSPEQPFGTVIGSPDRYAVPFRCLVPLRVDNLLVVGRSASFTSLAASSARVLPLGMVCGQAAGIAAAQSIRESTDFRQMCGDIAAIGRLRAALTAQGAYLEDFAGGDPNMSHRAYAGLAELRRIGLMDGGYQNDYRLDEAIDKWRFQYLLDGLIRKAGYSLPSVEVPDPPTNRQIADAAARTLTAADELKEWAQRPAAEAGEAPDAGASDGASGGAPEPGVTAEPGGAAAGESGGDASDGASGGEGGTVLSWPADSRSHRQNLDLLSEAGLLADGLAPYFSDEGGRPLAAETVMLLAELYRHIRL